MTIEIKSWMKNPLIIIISLYLYLQRSGMHARTHTQLFVFHYYYSIPAWKFRFYITEYSRVNTKMGIVQNNELKVGSRYIGTR